MDLSKSILLPLGAIALVGACAPYPPAPNPYPNPSVSATDQPALTGEEQRQIEENRERLRRQKEERDRISGNGNDFPVQPPKPANKPKYPTASAVPGKEGFVFNPYTHNIVDVKGIASGKLVKDPEDSDPTHKFRVP